MNLFKTIVVLGYFALGAVLWGCGGGSDGGDFVPPPATFTLSGTVYSAAGNRVDSDVNDPSADQFVTNNDFDTAQSLTAPVVLGGYVNLAGLGAPGATYADGDPRDFFQVTLDEGSVVRVVLPDDTDSVQNQVSLFLYSNSTPPELIGSIAKVVPAALIAAPASGTYFIEVQATAGATAYQLIVDLPDASAQAAGLGTAAAFVPGEVLVKFKADRSASAVNMADNLSMGSGLRTISSSAGGWMRMRTSDLQGTLRRMNLAAASGKASFRSDSERQKARREDTLSMIKALRARQDVAYAQPNYIRRPHFAPNDPLYPLQWHYDLIHLPEAWDLTVGSEDVIVAVIDSGIIDHPDLPADRIVGGYDFISDPSNAADGDGTDDNPNDPGDGTNNDSSFHGTHVAGTIAAAFDNGIGVAGVGGLTRIMPVRALGREGGYDYDIARAIRWAAGLDVTDENGTVIQGADPPADIINMSLGGPGRGGENDILHEAVQAAYSAGVILVSSAGNSADNTVVYPAGYDEVISVSAVDARGSIAYYSSFGATIDVAAPGGDVYMDIQPDGYADGVLSTAGSDADGTVRALYSFANGTSMSAPHVSGVAALMKAVNPLLDGEMFRAYLQGEVITQTAPITADLGDQGRDNLYGYGLIDAYAAVVAAGQFSPPAALSVTPRELHFDDETNTASLYLTKTGEGELTLAAAGSDAAWLTVTPSDGSAFGQYAVAIDRSMLAGGVQTGHITFEAVQGDTIVVPVTVEVLPDPDASAGTQYLLLVNALTLAQVQVVPLTLSAGAYHFVLTGVPEGSYYLLAGSDIDGNGHITNQGEAQGGYPSIASFRPILVAGNMSGLDFISGFTQYPYLLQGDASILP